MATKTTPKTFQLPKRYKPGFMRGLDRRSATSRQLRADFNAIIADLGGEENLPRAMLTFIERYVFLVHVLQKWERTIEKNPKEHAQLYNRWVAGTNTLSGMAVKLGLKKSKSGAATIKEFLKTHRA
jgi:hypothetical protein